MRLAFSTISDQEILAALTGEELGRKHSDAAILTLYQRNKSPICRLVCSQGGSREDAEDNLQSGLCVLLCNVRKGKFRGECSLNTYLQRICRNLWYKNTGKAATQREQQLKENEDHAGEEQDRPDWNLMDREKYQRIKKFYLQMGENCLQIIDRFLANMSMAEIATELSYKNKEVVANRKAQCLKNLKKKLSHDLDFLAFVKEEAWKI